MSEQEKLARAMLGAICALYKGYVTDWTAMKDPDNMFRTAIDYGMAALDIENTPSQRQRLTEEFIALLRGDIEKPAP